MQSLKYSTFCTSCLELLHCLKYMIYCRQNHKYFIVRICILLLDRMSQNHLLFIYRVSCYNEEEYRIAQNNQPKGTVYVILIDFHKITELSE